MIWLLLLLWVVVVVVVVGSLEGPKTARLEGKMTWIPPGLILRRISRIVRVESTLTRSPRSRLASAAPLMRPWRR